MATPVMACWSLHDVCECSGSDEPETIMATMGPLDAMFMLMEAREKPAHLGGLQLFQPPPGAPPDHLSRLYAAALSSDRDLHSVFTKRAYRPGGIGPWSWRHDDNFDLEYHLRHSALARPGRIRELLALVSRLHGSLLDRNRPLWETHMIEGIADGRFALYAKLHHALMDGVSAMHLITSSLSADPDERDMAFPWERHEAPPEDTPRRSLVDSLTSTTRIVRGLPGDLTGAATAAMHSFGTALLDDAPALPYRAPRTMLNVPITGARRFAAQSWSLARVKAAGAQHGATINDMVLAMAAGAVRSYLLEHHALPDKPLIAMVPVSLKTRAAPASSQGNAVGALLCNLGTDLGDPGARLAAIQTSMGQGKEAFAGLTPLQVLVLSALQLAPAALPTLGLGNVDLLKPVTPPVFNIVISNVPGPERPLYFNGARMTGHYPISVLVDGQAMNITTTSYAGRLQFGIIGDRTRVPHLQRMLVHLEDELVALES